MRPAGEPLAGALYQAALRAGAEAFTYIHLRDEDSLAIEATGDPDLLAAVNPMLKLMYETCHVVVRIDASENTQALSDYPAGSQQARTQALGLLLDAVGGRLVQQGRLDGPIWRAAIEATAVKLLRQPRLRTPLRPAAGGRLRRSPGRTVGSRRELLRLHSAPAGPPLGDGGAVRGVSVAPARREHAVASQPSI